MIERGVDIVKDGEQKKDPRQDIHEARFGPFSQLDSHWDKTLFSPRNRRYYFIWQYNKMFNVLLGVSENSQFM